MKPYTQIFLVIRCKDSDFYPIICIRQHSKQYDNYYIL